MPHHDKASDESKKCCETLVKSLQNLIPGLVRSKSQETCALYVPGKNRFAHVYHRGKAGEIRVYFRGDMSLATSYSNAAVVINRRDKIEKGWDKEFPLFAAVSNDESIVQLAKVLEAIAYPLSEKKSRTSSDKVHLAEKLIADIKQIESEYHSNPTNIKIFTDARIGQGKFGLAVRSLWNHRCSVSGASTKVVLEASHIKSWSDSNDFERLDPHNGLLLTANLHKLFDAGLISFANSGDMLLSPKLTPTEQQILGVTHKGLCKAPSLQTLKYLAHHRLKYFKNDCS